MRILTISASPYALTKLGRMNASLIRSLKDKGNEVASAVWHLDPTYYLPDEGDDKHYYEVGDERVCRLYRIDLEPSEAVKQSYEAMKEFQPDVVLTVGDYYETDFVHVIKNLYPQLFKWVAVLTINAGPIEPSHKDALNCIDQAVVTSLLGSSQMARLTSVPLKFSNPGIDHSIFYPSEPKADIFRIVANLKNSQACNAPALVSALSYLKIRQVPFEAYLHVNLNDHGDYDFRALLDQFNIAERVTLPKQFCSVQEGPPDGYLRQQYSRSHVMVDTSMRSATAMSLLEGMACGCVPVAAPSGAIQDVLTEMPPEVGVGSNRFVGERLQDFRIISDIQLANTLQYLWNEYKMGELPGKKYPSTVIAQRYSRGGFVLDVEHAIGRAVGETRPVLVVDELA
jgi:glycosyltransferase involved in cell wall biosynthesis